MLDGLITWLADAVKWLWDLVKDAFTALFDLLKDLAVWIFDGILTAVGAAIAAIPVPAFLSTGLQSLFAGLDGSVLYFLGPLRLTEGFAMIGAAVAFRLARKALTLFQW